MNNLILKRVCILMTVDNLMSSLHPLI